MNQLLLATIKQLQANVRASVVQLEYFKKDALRNNCDESERSTLISIISDVAKNTYSLHEYIEFLVEEYSESTSESEEILDNDYLNIIDKVCEFITIYKESSL